MAQTKRPKFRRFTRSLDLVSSFIGIYLHSTASLVDSHVCGVWELEIQSGRICVKYEARLGSRYIGCGERKGLFVGCTELSTCPPILPAIREMI